MDYQRIYDQIIERAKLSGRKKVKGGQYFESHHIIPVSVGGNNSKENKVLLTAREHYVCHKLLTFIYPNDKKIFYGYYMMSVMTNGNRDYKISSREFESIRLVHSKYMSEIMSGFKFTEEQIKNRPSLAGENNPMFGKNRPDLALYNKENPHTGKRPLSEKEKERRKNETSGENNINWKKVYTREELNKLSIGHKKTFLTCPYCQRISNGITYMRRFHFDNCKLNPNFIPKEDKRILLKCPYCDYESKECMTMKQWHFDNCKMNPNRIDNNICCVVCHKIGRPSHINGKHLKDCKILITV